MAKISGFQEFVCQINQRIDDELRNRNEVEIARDLEKEQAESAFREAMETGTKPAPWFVFGQSYGSKEFVINAMEKATGRKNGEGVGSAVAGKKRAFLPGEQGLVGLDVRPGVNCYAVEGFKYFGLSPLAGGDLPTGVAKHDNPIIAKITSPDWYIIWVVKERGELSTYNLANKNGVASVPASRFPGDTNFRLQNWSNMEGEGAITLADILTAHGLPTETPAISKESENRFFRKPVVQEVVDVPTEKTVVFEVMPKAKNVKCECGNVNPIVGADRKKYLDGESVKITCSSCHGSGIVKK